MVGRNQQIRLIYVVNELYTVNAIGVGTVRSLTEYCVVIS